MNISNALSLPFAVSLIASAVLVASCDACKPSSKRYHAVGTYIGGGSILFGADDCTYEGGPSVFQTSGNMGEAKSGPRFVFAPGKIVQRCKETMFDVDAIAPTAAVISGPAKIKRGAENNERFSGHFVADGRELEGQGQIEWLLGHDCEGIATFDAVLGSQDTGGPDRTRKRVPAAAGKCTVILTMTTGGALESSFASKAFQAEQLVTIE